MTPNPQRRSTLRRTEITRLPPELAQELPPTNDRSCHLTNPPSMNLWKSQLPQPHQILPLQKERGDGRSRSGSRGSKDLKDKLKVITPSLPTVQTKKDLPGTKVPLPQGLYPPSPPRNLSRSIPRHPDMLKPVSSNLPFKANTSLSR